MKKLILSIVILAGLAVMVFIFTAKKDGNSKTNSTATSTTNQTISINPSGGGFYLSYTDDIIAKTSGTKLLFFYAPWCPQCRALEADIKTKGLPEGLTIIKVDYDTNQSLRQKYGVTIQTTLVKIDDKGDLIKKYVAYDEPNLEAVIKNLL